MAVHTNEVRTVYTAKDRTSGPLTKMRGNLTSVQRAAATLGLTFGAWQASRLAGEIVAVSANFQRLHASLITVTGSATAADAAFTNLQNFASTTPYQLENVVEAFIKMKALGLDPSNAALASYGNTAAAMGKDLNQMIEAVADATVGEFERLKEFGIKARSQGDQVSFTFQGVTTTIQKSAEDISRYLQEIGDNQFAGAMDRQMETLGGAISNLEDNWDNLLVAFGNLAPITGAARALSTLAEQLREVISPTLRGQIADMDSQIMQLGNTISEQEELAMFSGGSPALDRLNQQMADLIARRDELKADLADIVATAAGSGGGAGGSGGGGGGGDSAITSADGILGGAGLSPNDRESRASVYQAEVDLLRQTNEQKIEAKAWLTERHIEFETQMANATIDQLERQRAAHEALNQFKVNAQLSAAQQGIALLNVFAGQSKKAALAAMVLQKGLAIGQTFVSGKAAEIRALAELGPIAGPPMAATNAAWDEVNMGVIAATGIAQAAVSGGGGGNTGGGTPDSPIVTQPLGSGAQDQQQTINIKLIGAVTDAYIEDELGPAIERLATRNATNIVVQRV